MSNEKPQKTYIQGIRIFKPFDGAPDFVIGNMAINPEELAAWILANPTYTIEGKDRKTIPAQVIRQRDGNITITLDQWKVDNYHKTKKEAAKDGTHEKTDDLPF
jgi:hypothetical protein